MPKVLVPDDIPYDTVLLSSEKWASINAHLTREQEEAARRQRVRDELGKRKAISKQMKDYWPDTLVKLHAKRLNDRVERLRKKEEDQLVIDAEEAKTQAAIRKEKLDCARKMLFHQEDQVKGIDSAIILSEVLKERDEQVKLKCRLRAEERERDKQWLQHMRWDWSEQARAGQREENARRAVLQRSNTKEKESSMLFKEALAKKELEEAEQMRLTTEQYNRMMKLEKQEELKQKQERKQGLLELLRQQRAFELLKAIRDREENAEIRVFGKGKLAMAKEIRATRREILDMAARRSEKACELLAKMYQKAASDEDARIAAVVKQKQEQEDAENAAKAATRAAMVKTITEHRLQELARHREEERQADEAKRQERLRMFEEDVRLASELRDRHQDLINEREENGRGWKEQVEEIEAKRLATKCEDYEEVQKLNDMAQEERTKFCQYANAEIDQLQRDGRNTYPVRVAARDGKPGGFLRHSTDWSSIGIRPN